MYIFLWLMLLAIGASSVHGAHFRGGTMSWKPTDNINEVEVTYKMNFNGFREAGEAPPKGHERCNQYAKHFETTLSTTGYLDCTGCVGFGYKDMDWKCSDFSIVGGWDIGGNNQTVKVNSYNKKATMSFNQCCWVGPLVNGNIYNEHQGYKMITEIDLNPRPDTGEINSSPITESIPVQLFHSHCLYHLEIPVTDPDNDPYRCRYTNTPIYRYNDECYDNDGQNDKSADICRELSYVTVYENCTLVFDTSGGPGWYAVRVMIEDLDAFGDPLSRVSLSFLLEVGPDSSTCRTPIIIAPKVNCKTIPVNEVFLGMIVAEAATAELYIRRIETTKPHGMSVSALQDVPGEPLQKAIYLSWTPTTKQLGKHQLGFNVVDRDGFYSGWTFITLNVDASTIIYPVPQLSIPSPGQIMKSTSGWTVRFNRPIERPANPAYITLLDSSGGVVDRLDASNEQSVSFAEQEVTFSMILNRFGTQNYTLVIDGGVAIETHGECHVYSNPMQWDLVIIGAEAPVTKRPPTGVWAPTPPSNVEPTILRCKPGGVDIPPPPGTLEGEECFIHVTDSTVTVLENSLHIPYKICCPSSCNHAPPGPPGPPGCVKK